MTTPQENRSADPASAKLIKQVRSLELRTRRLVDARLSGEYLSTFKGQGIEFAEVRPYQAGDDVRSIDWNVTARLREPFVKRYVEERELNVLFIIDLSGSDQWGTRGRLKSQLVAEVTATIAMSASRNGDRVGLLIVTDEVELFIPARKGRRHVLRLIRELLAFTPRSRGTDLSTAANFAQRVLRHRALIFVFSDFRLGEGWGTFGEAITALRTRHDVVACHLMDPTDFELPDIGLLRVGDPETGVVTVIDTGSAAVRARYAELANLDETRARRLFARAGIDEIRLRTDRPYAPALIGFFRRRGRRTRR